MGKSTRKSHTLLPEVFQTTKNKDFLTATLDQLIEPTKTQKLSQYIGHTTIPSYKSTDGYVPELTDDRTNYQLEPATIYKSNGIDVDFAAPYIDVINDIEAQGGTKIKHDRLLENQTYSYAPPIDHDKFVNYREYFWLPQGLSPIRLQTGTPGATVQFDVVNSFSGAYKFSHKTANNPDIIVYKGNTYKFKVDAVGHPFSIKSQYGTGTQDMLESPMVENNGADNGTVTLQVPASDSSTQYPTIIFYQCQNHIGMKGRIIIRDLADENFDPAENLIGTTEFTDYTGLTVTNGLPVSIATDIIESYQNKNYYVEGVGTSITLTPESEIRTYGTWAKELGAIFDESGTQGFDTTGWDNSTGQLVAVDYWTVNRSARDRNAWSRSNRWFHKDVIALSNSKNNNAVVLTEDQRAKRPIIEFEPGLNLHNHGYTHRLVDVVDTQVTDALSLVSGTLGFIADGTSLRENDLVVFTQDTEQNDKIFQVKFYDLGDSTAINPTRLHLQIVDDSTAIADATSIVGKRGNNQGIAYHYSSADQAWTYSQQKTKVQQKPLFDVFTDTQISLSNLDTFISTDFTGSTVFEINTDDTQGTPDTVYGTNVIYSRLGLLSDMQVNDTFNTDTITYVQGTAAVTDNIKKYYLRKTDQFGEQELLNNYRTHTVDKHHKVVEQYVADLSQTDFEVGAFQIPASLSDLTLLVFVNGIKTTEYTTVSGVQDKLFIKLTTAVKQNDIVTIKSQSTTGIRTENGYYEVPPVAQNNPMNESVSTLTIGDYAKHWYSALEELDDLSGSIVGANNSRDKKDVIQGATKIVQHEGSMPLASLMLRDDTLNIIDAWRKTGVDYEQFKTNILRKSETLVMTDSASKNLDIILDEINANKNASFAYYDSDMIAYGDDKTTLNYTVADSAVTLYPITTAYDLKTLSQKAIYIYLNGTQLVHGKDYEFIGLDDSANFVGFDIKTALETNDKITVDEFDSTVATFVPPTPSKLGLAPAYEPTLENDDIYLNEDSSTQGLLTIKGHDGSRTIGFNDFRDDILLEFEKRIYNNIKITHNPEALEFSYGRFKTNSYTRTEVINAYARDFYYWTGTNGIDYVSNDVYQNGEPFTWNYADYSKTINRNTDKNPLPGHWRGVYLEYFDTVSPHSTPWEMFGFGAKPNWWDSRYGSAPYTRGNNVLWNDVARGTIAQGDRAGTYNKYKRTNIYSVIPTGENGELVAPPNAGLLTDDTTNSLNLSRKWSYGDMGPAEWAWRSSSSWRFAEQIAKFLAHPAKYAGVFFDISRNNKNAIDQKVYNGEYRQSPSNYILPSTAQTSGYINIVYDYIKSQGLTSTALEIRLQNLSVQLVYKLAGFSNKQNLDVKLSSFSPLSSNQSVFTPKENYSLVLHKSAPTSVSNYSGVIVEKSTGGYKVSGYSNFNRSFKINAPITSRDSTLVSVGQTTDSFSEWQPGGSYSKGWIVRNAGIFYRALNAIASGDTFNEKNWSAIGAVLPLKGGVSVSKFANYHTNITTVPYGTEYETIQDLANFVYGYDRHLQSIGFVFNEFSGDLGLTMDWDLSIKEILFWTTQNWSNGSVLSVSPASSQLTHIKPASIGDDLVQGDKFYTVLQQDGLPIIPKNLRVSRADGELVIATNPNEDGIYNADIRTVQKEHLLILDNKTSFKDVIYDIELGARQERLKLVGFKTADWQGDLYSPGFIIDRAQITEWTPYTDYKVGDVVNYQGDTYVSKNNYTATDVFDPLQFAIKPTPRSDILNNLDNKAESFRDFYSLDTENFDAEQQRYAQHLIGYQKRDYLVNLGFEEATQYKLYQGFIRDKGTNQVIEKFKLPSQFGQLANFSLYEEWMVRIGEYGGHRATNQFAWPVTDASHTELQQVYHITDTEQDDQGVTINVANKEFNKRPYEIPSEKFTAYSYDTSNYPSNILKMGTAGYPQLDQVDFTVFNTADIELIDVSTLKEGSTIWIANTPTGSWDVRRVNLLNNSILSYTQFDDKVQFTTQEQHGLNAGDYIAILNFGTQADGIYLIADPLDSTDTAYKFTITFDGTLDSSDLDGDLAKIQTVRTADIDNLQDITPNKGWQSGDYVYVDNAYETNGGSWQVWQRDALGTFTFQDALGINTDIADRKNDNEEYGGNLALSTDTKFLAVTAKGAERLLIYNKPKDTDPIAMYTQIVPGIKNTTGSAADEFGTSVAITDDGGIILVGAPNTQDIVKMTAQGPSQDSTRSFSRGQAVVGGDTGATGTVMRYEEGATQDVFYVKVTSGTNFDDSTLNASDSSSVSIIDKVITDGDRTAQGTVNVITQDTNKQYAISANLLSPEIRQGERFGETVAISGDGEWIAVGAPGGPDDSALADSGQVYVFKKGASDSTGLAQYELWQTLTPNTLSQVGARFGETLEMSNDGSVIAVGVKKYDDSTLADQGIVFVWKKSGPTYVEVENLRQDTAQANTQFGTAIQLSTDGTDLLISAPRETVSQPNEGAVYHFVNQTSTHIGDGSTTAFVPTFTVEKYTRLLVSTDLNTWAFDDSSSPTATTYHVNESTNTVTLSSTPAFGETVTISQYQRAQKIVSQPVKVEGQFGTSMSLSGTNLAVYSANGNNTISTTFDKFMEDGSTVLNETTFDAGGTSFSATVNNTGSVQLFSKYDTSYLHNETLSYAGATINDSFGKALAISTQNVYVGAPGVEVVANDSSTRADAGEVYFYEKTSTSDYWTAKITQDDLMNPNLVQKTFMYTRINNQKVIDMPRIDPAKGLFFAEIEENIRFKTPFDPANYSAWNDEHIGEVWLDTSQLKFLWYEQGDLEQRLANWGKIHPSSLVSVKEWTSSNLIPSQYNALSVTVDGQQQGITGTAQTNFFAKNVFDDNENAFVQKYFFWVDQSTIVPEVANRSISTASIASTIRDPKTYSENYCAIIDSNSILMSIQPSILTNKNLAFHVEATTDTDPIQTHEEYVLLSEGDTDVAIPTTLINKYEDSLIGVDVNGRSVPDLDFPEDMRYGILNRPRQSLFKDRLDALKTVVKFTNTRLLVQPYATQVDLTLFTDTDPVPNVLLGDYNQVVDTEIDLEYINTEAISAGYKILVTLDSLAQGWSIYTYDGSKFNRTRGQSYDTNKYWSYADYYSTGYSSETVADIIVANETARKKLSPTIGQIVKVKSSYNGAFRCYLVTGAGYDVVAIGNGTIQLDASLYDYASTNRGFGGEAYDSLVFDQEAIQELRNILQAISKFSESSNFDYQEIFFTAIKVALAQDPGADWIVKSSFVKKTNEIESISQQTEFQLDVSNSVEDFFNEVLPFKTQVRDDVSKYGIKDTIEGDFTDFDNPTYWDSDKREYVNPTIVSGDSTYFDAYQNYPHKFFADNYKYTINEIAVDNGGAGYTVAPVVTVSDGGGSGTVAKANIQNGAVLSITVTTQGTGYTSQPTVTLTGGGGTVTQEAKVHAVLLNNKIRKLNETIKFDRVSGNHALANGSVSIKTWEKDTVYAKGDNIRFGNEIYRAIYSFVSGETFEADVLLDDSTINNDSSTANYYQALALWNAADRIYAFYDPTTNMPGLLGDGSTTINAYAQLMTGLEYPGTRLRTISFGAVDGYDQSNYDTLNFDDATTNEDPDTTADQITNLDVLVDSKSFTTNLGTRAEDINVVGDAFISEYSAHAPEEVLPGGVYDTMDMKVFTRATDGASIIQKRNYYGDGSTVSFSIPEPKSIDGIRVFINDHHKNLTADYTIDYKANTITFTSAPEVNSIIKIVVIGVSTDNLLAKSQTEGDGSTIAFDINVSFHLVQQTYVLVNGVKTAHTISQTSNARTTTVTFSSAPADNAIIDVYAFDLPASTKAFSEVEATEYTLPTDSTEIKIALTTLPGVFGPWHHKVFVEGLSSDANGTGRYKLNPPQVKYYTGDDTSTTFLLPDEPVSSTLATPSNIEVYKNGIKLSQAEYVLQFNALNKGIVNFNTSPASTDSIALVLKIGMDYTVDEDGTLTMNGDWSDGSTMNNEKIKVTTFNNHNQMNMRTEIFAGATGALINSLIDYGSVVGGTTQTDISYGDLGATSEAITDFGAVLGSTQIIDIQEKVYQLANAPINSDYVFVALNKGYLTANVDYRIEGSRLFLPRRALGDTDTVTITYLSGLASKEAMGYRVFKDILNRTHYRRLSKAHSTRLVLDLGVSDTTITVIDGTNLPDPDIANNSPGVIFIGTERINYFVKDGNTISRIVRGTLGTGVQHHIAGSVVVDGSKLQSVSGYEDTTTTDTHTADGNVFYGTTFTPTDANELVVQVGGTATTEFTIGSDSSTNGITFNTAPSGGLTIKITRKTGAIWNTAGSSTAADGLGLQQSSTSQSLFLKASPADLSLI